MNVKIDQESLSALREQLRQVADTCSQMKHCLVRDAVADKPMVLDYLDMATRLTRESIDAFNEAMLFLAMTPEEFVIWWTRQHESPFTRKS